MGVRERCPRLDLCVVLLKRDGANRKEHERNTKHRKQNGESLHGFANPLRVLRLESFVFRVLAGTGSTQVSFGS